MSGPLVSVVIPAYGHAELIGATLASVFAQTFTAYEVIVVVDGSPDDTADRLRPLAAAGKLRLIEQTNAGQAAARNRGIGVAHGKYVALLDDDDLWPADKLAWQVDVMERDAALVMTWGDSEQLHEDGTRMPPKPTEYPPGRSSAAAALRRFRFRCHLRSPGQALIRTEALNELGGFDEAVWGTDDWDLYLGLARLGPVWYEPRVALTYRLHAGNASATSAVRHARNHFTVARKHLGSFAGHPWRRLRNHVRVGRYFVPNLIAAADRAAEDGDAEGARQAVRLAVRFRPYLLLRRRYRKLFAGQL